MGFFSKIFKGVKKVFKKIGKGIKGVFKGIGKFMNKLGVAGQIALMFVPGIGPMLSGMLKGLGGVAATALGSMGTVGNAILSGAKFVIGKASAFAGGVKNTFRTITQGVKTFAGEFTKTALNKMGFDPTKFGWSADGSFDTWVKSGKGQTFGDAWSKVTTNITDNASKILDPFRKSVVADSGATLDTLSDMAGKGIMSPKYADPTSPDFDLDSGYGDPSTLPSVKDAVTGGATDTGADSLLGMPTLGSAATQVGVNVASQAAMGALAGDPPEMGYGQLVDAGFAPVSPATPQQNFMQAAADPYMNYRDPQGSYGYGVGNNNTYMQYMNAMGLT